MDRSTKTPRGALLPCAVAVAAIFAAVPAYADGETQQSTTTTQTAFSTPNPCYRNPVTKEREVENVNGTATQRTTIHTHTKPDTFEYRQHDRTDGEGVGDRSAVRYFVKEDRRLNIRSKRDFNRTEQRLRQMGRPENAFVPTDTGARSFVVTFEEESVTKPPRPTRVETDQDTKCQDQRGRDRHPDDGRDRDHEHD